MNGVKKTCRHCARWCAEAHRLRRMVAYLMEGGTPRYAMQIGTGGVPTLLPVDNVRYAKAVASRRAEDMCEEYAAIYEVEKSGRQRLVLVSNQRSIEGKRRWKEVGK